MQLLREDDLKDLQTIILGLNYQASNEDVLALLQNTGTFNDWLTSQDRFGDKNLIILHDMLNLEPDHVKKEVLNNWKSLRPLQLMQFNRVWLSLNCFVESKFKQEGLKLDQRKFA